MAETDTETIARLERALLIAEAKLDGVRSACQIAELSTDNRIGNRPWMLIELVRENLDAMPGSIAGAILLSVDNDDDNDE